MDQYLEKIGNLCADIENELSIYNDYVSDNLVNITLNLAAYIRIGTAEYKVAVAQQLKDILSRTDAKKYPKIWLYSTIFAITGDASDMEEFLKYIISEKNLSVNVKCYLYHQTVRDSFLHAGIYNETVKYFQWKLFEQIIGMFKSSLNELFLPIPETERDESMVLVMTGQLLGSGHAPTDRCLDRCKMLLDMNKKVLLINTAEILSFVGEIKYFGAQKANYYEEFLMWDKIEWKGAIIPFFQCERNMPSVDAMRQMLQMVRRLKPGMALSIGGSSVMADLTNLIVPVLTVGLSASEMQITMSACQTLSRELQTSDLQFLKEFGMDQNNIIRSISNFSLPEQNGHITRKDLGLPENKFIIAVTGNRLNTEIDDDFIDMLCRIDDDEIGIALIGKMKVPEQHSINNRSELKEKLYCLGESQCFLEWIEVCDLYVNPCRRGGGTMAVMALSKGIPVVTIPYGDAAVNVGEEFWTESYDTMPDLIRRYKNDENFYHQMAEKAKERSDVLTDAESEFRRVLEEFKKRTRHVCSRK